MAPSPAGLAKDHFALRQDPFHIRSVRQQNVPGRCQGFQAFHMLVVIIQKFFKPVPEGYRFQPLNRRLASIDGVIFELQKLANNGL